MFRFLFSLLGLIVAGQASRRSMAAGHAPQLAMATAPPAPGGSPAQAPGAPGGRPHYAPGGSPSYPAPGPGGWPAQPAPEPGGWPAQPVPGPGGWPAQPVPGPGPSAGPGAGGGRPRLARLRRRVIWVAALLAAGLIFRRAIASLVLIALSATLHLVGIDAHLPSVKFGWPWSGSTAGTTTTTNLGPWVLQKIEGISRPALGQANFNFVFTRKVSKNIGIWPCWYASTFYAVGHAAATVNLNPGPSWWRPGTGHYRLQVLSRPAGSQPGRVSVQMVLPPPQLPQSGHQVTIDNLPSRPVSVQHSWTYPGFGCGVLLRPQFAQSVLYAQAQQIAFYKARHAPQVTAPLIRSAERQATLTIRDNFIQPTVNALGYRLDGFTLRWAGRAP